MNTISTDFTDKEHKWLGEAVAGLFSCQSEERGVLGYKKIVLLIWLLNNKKDIGASYRKIAKASGVSVAVVHRTFSDLLDLGKIEREEGNQRKEELRFFLVFSN